MAGGRMPESRTLREAGAERRLGSPKESPRAGGGRETGGRKALKGRGAGRSEQELAAAA